MAVYQGARRRAPLPFGLDVLTRRDAEPQATTDQSRGRRSATAKKATNRARATTRRAARTFAGRRPSTVGIALGAIVLVFSAAFLSLSQSVRVAATGYDIVRLVSEHDRLQAIRQDLQSDVERLRSEPAIRKEALDSGLGQLGAPLVVQAR
jgi:hypothetical protein